MASEVESSSKGAPTDGTGRLALASLSGALFVMAGVVLAGYVVPDVWKSSVSPAVSSINSAVDFTARVVVQLITILVVARVGLLLSAGTPPPGVRGGITLTISALIAGFFVVRAVGMNFENAGIGLPITLFFLGGTFFLIYKLLFSQTGQRWMKAVENQGWASTFSYKKTQGLVARRLTLLGFLLITGSGIVSMYAYEVAGKGELSLRIPFTETSFVLFSDAETSTVLLGMIAVFWLSWRAINIPSFADFLIATEAEMNKVSWPSRRGLVQDTIVVLFTTLLLTLFLFVVDLFWGWLLSLPFIQILPGKTGAEDGVIDAVQGKIPQW